MNIRWQKVLDLIRRHKTFLLTTHVFPDGDGVGSELALAEILKSLGKNAFIVNADPIPKIYKFLDPKKSIKTYSPPLDRKIKRCDAALILDVSSRDRVGVMADVIEKSGITCACIDHHETNSVLADISIVGHGVASTGELIYDLAHALRTPLTPRAAEALFVAVGTDTGWFRFSNTDVHALTTAAHLVELGARPNRLYEAIYETHEWPRVALMSRVLATLQSACDGRIAYIHLTEKMLRETGATHEDAENFVDIPRVIHGVQMVLFFREVDGKIKVSMRSKGGPPVHRIAAQFGGGGHARAAGIRAGGTLAKVMRDVLAACKKSYRSL